MFELIPWSSHAPTLDELYDDARALASLRGALAEADGLIVAVGTDPIASATFADAVVQQCAAPDRKVVQACEAAHRPLAGTVQLECDSDARGCGRTLLAQDADVIVVDESPPRTSLAAVTERMAGRALVVRTLTCGSTADALRALAADGTGPGWLAHRLRAVVRLERLRTLCPHCRRPVPVDALEAGSGASSELLTPLARTLAGSLQRFCEAPGCERCDGTGGRARVARARGTRRERRSRGAARRRRDRGRGGGAGRGARTARTGAGARTARQGIDRGGGPPGRDGEAAATLARRRVRTRPATARHGPCPTVSEPDRETGTDVAADIDDGWPGGTLGQVGQLVNTGEPMADSHPKAGAVADGATNGDEGTAGETHAPLILRKSERPAPVFIVGSGRSGNTLLRRLLMAGGEVYIPPETYVLGRILSDVRRLSPWADWHATVSLVLGHFALSEDFDTFPTSSLRPVKVALEALPEKRRSLAAILDAFYQHMARAAGSEAHVWGDKTPLNAVVLDELIEVFPKARVIWMYRDGYDVTASYLAMGRYADPVSAAERWVRSNEACAACARARPEQVHRIRYEDLVADPRAALATLCAWLGLRYDDEMVNCLPATGSLGDTTRHAHHAQVHQPISTDSVGRGRERLGADVSARLASIIDPVTRELS